VTVTQQPAMCVDGHRTVKPNAFVRNKVSGTPFFSQTQSLQLQENYM
jgi:hypothetical protein